MKFHTAVQKITWASEGVDSDNTYIDFTVYKKKMLGGLKPILSNWCLVCRHDENGNIDINNMSIQDDNIMTRPFDHAAAWSVLNAARDSMSKAGYGEKEQILSKASRLFYRKYFLNEDTELSIKEPKNNSEIKVYSPSPGNSTVFMSQQKMCLQDNIESRLFDNINQYKKFIEEGEKVTKADGCYVASLCIEGDALHYHISYLENGKVKYWHNDLLHKFEPTEQNFIKFNEGCDEIAKRLLLLIGSGDMITTPPPFMELSIGWKMQDKSTENHVRPKGSIGRQKSCPRCGGELVYELSEYLESKLENDSINENYYEMFPRPDYEPNWICVDCDMFAAPQKEYCAITLTSIVNSNTIVYNEIEAREVVFMHETGCMVPWTVLGREKYKQEEFDVWVLLDSKEINNYQAIEMMTELMELYYNCPYPI